MTKNLTKIYQLKKQKHGGKGIGFGSAKKASKFDAKKDNGQMDGEFRIKPKKVEAKETARTNNYVTSGKVGRRKGSNMETNRREVRKESIDSREVQILREKNEDTEKH